MAYPIDVSFSPTSSKALSCYSYVITLYFWLHSSAYIYVFRVCIYTVLKKCIYVLPLSKMKEKWKINKRLLKCGQMWQKTSDLVLNLGINFSEK